jgi:hypothetical protein
VIGTISIGACMMPLPMDKQSWKS